MMPAADRRALRIVHILRSPLGGLFRHVMDLARGQVSRGHQVGIIADSTSGGDRADTFFASLQRDMPLGAHRLPMHRNPHPSDFMAQRAINRIIAASDADVVHGHGAKGGLYARLPGIIGRRRHRLRVYTPHGGALHYTPGTKGATAFMAAERLLERCTDLFLFECRFAAERYLEIVTRTRKPLEIVHNGVEEEELAPVIPAPDATDLLFIGELRLLKGIDTLIDAVSLLRDRLSRAPSLTLVGSGPDEPALRSLVAERGLSGDVVFAGAMPARAAFARGRVMIVPSRMESFPYVVLEAAAAAMPLVATNVGGIPEIFGPDAPRLVPPENAEALAVAIEQNQLDLARGDDALQIRLQSRVARLFTVDRMVGSVLNAYAAALIARKPQQAIDRDIATNSP